VELLATLVLVEPSSAVPVVAGVEAPVVARLEPLAEVA
jgi:hypothetical protein